MNLIRLVIIQTFYQISWKNKYWPICKLQEGHVTIICEKLRSYDLILGLIRLAFTKCATEFSRKPVAVHSLLTSRLNTARSYCFYGLWIYSFPLLFLGATTFSNFSMYVLEVSSEQFSITLSLSKIQQFTDQEPITMVMIKWMTTSTTNFFFNSKPYDQLEGLRDHSCLH